MNTGFEDVGTTETQVSDSNEFNESVSGIQDLLDGDDPMESQSTGAEADGVTPEQIGEGEQPTATVPPEAEPQEQEVDDLFTVNIDGQETELTLDELASGYRRHADYTRKTQELAEQRTAFETEKQQTEQARAQYAQLVSALGKKLSEMQGAEPDWTKLAAEDPAGYVQAKAEWDAKQNQLKAVRNEEERLEQEQAQSQMQEFQNYLVSQRTALLTAKPELNEPEKATEFFGKLNSYAKSAFGFTDAELGQIFDHRLMLLAEKAMMFDELQAQGKQVQKKVKSRPAPLKPGSARTSSQQVAQQARRQRERLEKSGSITDAAGMIEGLL